MKTKLLRRVAVTLGISACGFGSLQSAVAQQYGQMNGGFAAPAALNQQTYASPTTAYGQPAQATLLPPSATPQSQGFGPAIYSPPQAAAPAAVAPGYAAVQPQSNPAPVPAWNSFNNPNASTQVNYRPVASDGSMGMLPTPEPIPAPVPDYGTSVQTAPAPSHASASAPVHMHSQGYTPGASYSATGADCQSCNTGHSSAFVQAAQAPWGGGYGGDCNTGSCGVAMARPQIYPWFGGFNLLFLDVDGLSNKVLGIDNSINQASLYSSSVNSDTTTGFDVTAGRYLGCGKYGLGITYFRLDPDSEESIISGTAGDIRAAMQGYHDYALDLGGGGGPDQVYNHVFGTSGDSAGAENIRARRDLEFNGIEVNLFSFGLMGAQRAAPMCGDGLGGRLGGSGMRHKFAQFFGTGGHHGNYGYGGAAGPLVRPCNGKVQVATSHGFRWFQIRDVSQLAYNIDTNPGYQAADIYDDIDVENNLFGYQFGSRLTYCLTNRLNFGIGGKFGVYGNHVEANRRLGTLTDAAYRFGSTADIVDTSVSDTVLSTLGELDLGLGCRITNAWTVRGGYRVLGVTGIATGFDQISHSFGSAFTPGGVYASESLVLHGAYVGADFNF